MSNEHHLYIIIIELWNEFVIGCKFYYLSAQGDFEDILIVTKSNFNFISTDRFDQRITKFYHNLSSLFWRKKNRTRVLSQLSNVSLSCECLFLGDFFLLRAFVLWTENILYGSYEKNLRKRFPKNAIQIDTVLYFHCKFFHALDDPVGRPITLCVVFALMIAIILEISVSLF